MVAISPKRFPMPVLAFGNIDDPKETDADATATTGIALWRGILHELQNLNIGVPSGAATAAHQVTIIGHVDGIETALATLDAKAGQMAPTATATLTSLASSASSAQLLASTAGRKGLILTNTDANQVYVKYGTTASATSFTVIIPANSYWEMPQPIYTGRIDAIWAADGAGSLYSTELT